MASLSSSLSRVRYRILQRVLPDESCPLEPPLLPESCVTRPLSLQDYLQHEKNWSSYYLNFALCVKWSQLIKFQRTIASTVSCLSYCSSARISKYIVHMKLSSSFPPQSTLYWQVSFECVQMNSWINQARREHCQTSQTMIHRKNYCFHCCYQSIH